MPGVDSQVVHIEHFDDVDESFVSKFYHILVSIEGILAAVSHSRHYEFQNWMSTYNPRIGVMYIQLNLLNVD